MGTTLAIFQVSGKYEVESDELNILDKCLHSIFAPSFNSRPCIKSGPLALVVLINFSTSNTSWSVMTKIVEQLIFCFETSQLQLAPKIHYWICQLHFIYKWDGIRGQWTDTWTDRCTFQNADFSYRTIKCINIVTLRKNQGVFVKHWLCLRWQQSPKLYI